MEQFKQLDVMVSLTRVGDARFRILGFEHQSNQAIHCVVVGNARAFQHFIPAHPATPTVYNDGPIQVLPNE